MSKRLRTAKTENGLSTDQFEHELDVFVTWMERAGYRPDVLAMGLLYRGVKLLAANTGLAETAKQCDALTAMIPCGQKIGTAEESVVDTTSQAYRSA
jgi:hypothetical protein